MLWTPLVRRTREPQLGLWALPGGWLPPNEELEAAAARTLRATTGLAPNYLEQLYTFGEVDRSPGDRVVSVVYWALVRSDEADRRPPAPNVRWVPADTCPGSPSTTTASSSTRCGACARRSSTPRSRTRSSATTFTLAELREVYEVVLQRRLDPANFRRTMIASGECARPASASPAPRTDRPSSTATRPPPLTAQTREPFMRERPAS